MGKVVRADKDGVQKVRAKEIVPGDIVEVSGKLLKKSPHCTEKGQNRQFRISFTFRVMEYLCRK